MNKKILYSTVKSLMAKGKGILAADESVHSANKRLSLIHVKGTVQNRRRFRDLLLSGKNIEKYLSGVILHDETIRQKNLFGKLFVKQLIKRNIIPGIKVDQGVIELENFPNELITQGLDDLDERMYEYNQMGAKFAKWRAVILIDKNIPTQQCIDANTRVLARYSAICQVNSMVPIVEPEVLITGTHNMQKSAQVLELVLKSLFFELKKYKIDLKGLILKTSMVIPGNKSNQKIDHKKVAKMTTQVLKKCVPKEVGGIVFLSGGQSSKDALQNLNEIKKIKNLPWSVTFSFARALQMPAIEYWKGKALRKQKSQQIFLDTLEVASLASLGKLK